MNLRQFVVMEKLNQNSTGNTLAIIALTFVCLEIPCTCAENRADYAA